MKKLFTILLLALPVSGFAQAPSMKRNAFTTNDLIRTFVIPSGSGAITSIVWQSHSRYVLDAGTNTTFVSPKNNPLASPHILLRDLTNVTIEGLGWQSVLFCTQTGTVMTIFNCDQISIKNFAIIGTRGPEVLNQYPSQFSAIEERGTNRNMLYQDLLIQGHNDQGISGCIESDNSFTSNSVIRRCTFRNIGSTNGFFGVNSQDGTAIVINGRGIVIEDCFFFNNLRDFEPFTWNAQALRGIKITHNTSVGARENALLSQMVTLTDLEYSFNVTEADTTQAPGTGPFTRAGFSLLAGTGGKIVKNVFRGGFDIGLYAIASAGTRIEGWVIDGNTFEGNARGSYWGTAAATGTNYGNLICNNLFRNNWYEGLDFNGQYNQVLNNTFVRNCTNSGVASLIYWNGGGLTGSNLISGNVFFTDNSGGATGPQYHIQALESYGLFKDNYFYNDYTTAPWTDSGTGNQWINSSVGTNRLPQVITTNAFVTTFGGGTTGGTNVIWNVAANPLQAVVVTNTCLVIVTNNTGLNSSQRAKLVLVSNQTTNCGVFVTVAGVRLAGVDSALTASAIAAAHNSLTNGRVMIMEAEYFGTNLVVEVKHQR